MSEMFRTIWRLMRLSAVSRRAESSDLFLASVLALIAGAINLGGLFALGHFASHMTGYLSWLADGVVLAEAGLVRLSLMALVLFFIGGILSTFGLIWLAIYHPTLRVVVLISGQAVLLVLFAAAGLLPEGLAQTAGLGILCFTMGYQNAMITKMSHFTIRTTHMTGLVTDLSIEIGRFCAASTLTRTLRPDPRRTAILSLVIGLFVVGGILGSLAFGALGFAFTLPFALMLFALVGLALWPTRRRRND